MTRRHHRAGAPANQRGEISPDIPLSSPDYNSPSKPKSKTLYEIAAERQAQLASGAPQYSELPAKAEDIKYVKIAKDGTVQETSADGEIKRRAAESERISPLLDTLFLASSLSALHFTLDVLTAHQYAQELHFPPIIKNTLFVAFPTLTFAIHLFHGHLFPNVFHNFTGNVLNGIRVVQQLVFLLAANITGCYLIHLTNDKGYYAIMKRAPSIGTVWIWCIIELGLAGSLAGVIGPGIYAWYNEYGIF